MEKNNYYSSSSAMDEAIRTLRTNISFSSVDNKIKSLLITSSSPAEGKSTITVNLGRSMAQNGAKVLIIDCDLRHPSIGDVSGNTSIVGLTNYLVDKASINEIIIKDHKVENLHMLLTGPKPPNPAEILGSQKMATLLKSLKEHYDMILVDTPSVDIITDGAILSTLVDAVLLVVNQGETKADNLKLAKKNLENVGANILGVVMNKVKMKSGKYGYGYGRYY